jgi:ferredoxin-NADP reductase
VVALVCENARTQSIVPDPLDWPGHLAGQHVKVRLTAEDGYQAQRSYSIASAPEDDHLMLTRRAVRRGRGVAVPDQRRSCVHGQTWRSIRGP